MLKSFRQTEQVQEGEVIAGNKTPTSSTGQKGDSVIQGGQVGTVPAQVGTGPRVGAWERKREGSKPGNQACASESMNPLRHNKSTRRIDLRVDFKASQTPEGKNRRTQPVVQRFQGSGGLGAAKGKEEPQAKGGKGKIRRSRGCC